MTDPNVPPDGREQGAANGTASGGKTPAPARPQPAPAAGKIAPLPGAVTAMLLSASEIAAARSAENKPAAPLPAPKRPAPADENATARLAASLGGAVTGASSTAASARTGIGARSSATAASPDTPVVSAAFSRSQESRAQEPRPQEPRPQEPRPQEPRPQEPRPSDPSRSDPRQYTLRSPRNAIEPDKVDMPQRRSAGARHPVVVFGNAVISILVLVAVVAGIVLYYGKQRFEAPGPLAQDRVVNIPRGSGMRDIADVLTQAGVIDQPWVFIGGVLVLKAREALKAGEYEFKAHSSLRDVVDIMVEGKVVPHQIGIPEGLTSEQIVGRLVSDDVLIGDVKEVPREGSLLPDTYNFTRGVTREQMIGRMQQAQQHLVQEIWEHRAADLPLRTPEQLIVLASIVEKETGRPDERSRVAAVFINRLKQRMKLQSDPTIIYGLVGGKGSLGRPIMKSEIEQPTPYNTYVIDGLPPGPIANPGRAALEAVANPARTRELYFVADGTGGHVFAETYEQHQKNVARLRALENDQAPAGTDTTSAPASSNATDPSAAPSAPAPASSRKPRAQATSPH